MNALAGLAGLPASLIASESGGRFDARNDVAGHGGHRGHFGRGQFGVARLQDAMSAGVIPSTVTPEKFMARPDMQEAVERWHVSDVMRQAHRMGLDRFLGQSVGGVPVTETGMLAVAHLGGVGGLRRFLETGGAYDPADANGTRLSDYLRMHGGTAAPAQGAAPAGQPAPQDGNALAMMAPPRFGADPTDPALFQRRARPAPVNAFAQFIGG